MQSQTLTDVIKEHRRSKANGLRYECICGKPVPSNSHHRQAEHIAEEIRKVFEVKPRTKPKPKPNLTEEGERQWHWGW